MNEQVRSEDLMPRGDPDTFTAAQADVTDELARLAAAASPGGIIPVPAAVPPATEVHNLMQSAAERLSTLHSLFSKLVTVIVGEPPPRPALNDPARTGPKLSGVLGTLEADGHDFHSALDRMEVELKYLAAHF